MATERLSKFNNIMINIGILTNYDDRLAPFLLKKVYNLKKINFHVIISKTKINRTKSNRIFKERTGSFFLKKNLKLSNINLNLPTFLVDSHNSKKFYKIIKNRNIKYLYNSGTPNKIAKRTLKMVKGVINIHPGILPFYRGCTCPEWTLLNNDPLGITAHFMDENYDSGPIIKKQFLKFKKKDIKNYQDLRIKIFLSTFELARKIFKNINNLSVYKQNKNKSKYHKVIKRKDFLKIVDKIKRNKYKFNKRNLIE